MAGEPATTVHAIIAGATTATTVWTLDGTQLTLPHVDQPVTVTLPAADVPSPGDLLAHTATAPDIPATDPQLPVPALGAPPGVVLGTALDPLAVTDPGPRQVNLLGPVELTGIRWLRRGQILNLLAYLALHRRGVDRHQLLGALWADDPPTLKTMRNRISEARALVDGAITDGPIWRLEESVTTDWQQFIALGVGTPEQQRAALSLIRDRPFTGLDDCDWIDLESIRTEVEAAIVDLALTVAQRDFDAGDYVNALSAARAGLRASRYEERLHRLAIRAAEAQGLSGVVKTLKKEMRTALDEDIEPGDTVQPETLALYAEGTHRIPTSDASR
jgi:DNA-binding SARP family transcriptional activator